MTRREDVVPGFRALLSRAGLSLSGLEQRAGLARNDAWRYAAGRRSPRVKTLLRIADALRADPGAVARALARAQAEYQETRARRAATEAAINDALYRRV